MADNKTIFWVIGIGVVLYIAYTSGLFGGTGTTTPTPAPLTGQDLTAICSYQPTGSYSVKDLFGTTSISGTSYYKQDANAATTTAITNFNKGEVYEYWLDNATYYVNPVTLTDAKCGVNQIVANAYLNSTPTFTGYDLVNRQTSTAGTYNTSLSANDRASIQFTYQGTSKQSFAPFGGVFVLEYNSTVTSVTCTGADIATTNDFHTTYTVGYTAHTYSVWKLNPTIDDGKGLVRTIDCQFQNGATAPGAGSIYYAKIIPANYYITNDGNIVLDVEKYLNADTARTGKGTQSLTSYWAA